MASDETRRDATESCLVRWQEVLARSIRVFVPCLNCRANDGGKWRNLSSSPISDSPWLDLRRTNRHPFLVETIPL